MLRIGSRGSEVRRLQESLKKAGLYKGAVDGVFGNLTHQAVWNYQSRNNLSVDGIAGPQTLGHLGLSGGGGGGGGSSSSSTPSTPLQGVAGGGELWRIGRMSFVVYSTPKKGVPIAYRVENMDQLRALGSPSPSRTFSSMREAERLTGMIQMGTRADIRNNSENPFDSMVRKFDRLATSSPWLKDPEVLAIYAAATIEGRTPSQEELMTTEWFRSRNEAQREWATLSMRDPETAAKVRWENKNAVIDAARRAGIGNVDGRLADFFADKWTTGDWSQAETTEYIKRLADPHRGTLPKSLRDFLKSSDYDTTREHEDTVFNLVSEWLGPHVAKTWGDKKIREWAGKLRNDPNAQQNLIDSLRKQRLAKYKGYEDPNITYADIDSLWRPLVRSMWGEDPDHNDSVFEKVLQMNDSAGAERLLREKGLERGNRQIGMDLLSQMHDVLGGSVRQMA